MQLKRTGLSTFSAIADICSWELNSANKAVKQLSKERTRRKQAKQRGDVNEDEMKWKVRTTQKEHYPEVQKPLKLYTYAGSAQHGVVHL